MKKLHLFVLCVMSTTILCAQNAKFSYVVSLYGNDSINTYEYLRQNPCFDFESQISESAGTELKNALLPMFTHEDLKHILDSDIEYYQRCLRNNSFYNTTASAEKQKLDTKLADFAGLQKECGDFVMACTKNNIQSGYKDDFGFFKWNSYKFYSLFHAKVSNRAFRDAIYNKAVDLLCKMAAYYPKDYKTKLVKEFSVALNAIDEAQKHKYEVKNDNSRGWEQIVFFVDGTPNYQIGEGLAGFLLRRIYMDNIPYAEIREKTAILIAKIKAIDVSKNASVLCKYTINNELLYCIGSEENYFVANNKKMITYATPINIAYNTHVIKVRYNDGENFYQISNYKWCNEELKTVIVDKYMNVIFHSPNTLSKPINITQLQSPKLPAQQTQAPTKPQLTR